MHVWLQLLSRELLFLALLTALGLGPASYVSVRWGNTARVSLAPVLGSVSASV